MKKKFLSLLGIACFSLIIGVSGCNNKSNPSDEGGDVEPIQKTWTVAFEVDGVRYQTLKVKDGEHITQTVADPTKEGYVFSGWYEGTELVDLAEYVVTKNVTFVAHFDEDSGPQLNVDDVKDATKTYYLVLGWWETTDVNTDGTPKITSHMTRATTRLFYKNLIKYLKATGATDANIEAISFRNYSSDGVAVMGQNVTADGDVALLVGVGNNVNSTAGLTLYNSTNDSKFQTPMGEGPTNRYVALLNTTNELGVTVYDWLKGTEVGKASFIRELTDAEIEASLVPEEINLAVTIHGDTNVTTTLTDKTTAITMPAITVADGKIFKGFATTADAEEAQLEVAKDATLKYDDVKDLVADGANTLDLYPVIIDAPVVLDDLVVYVQVYGSYLTEAEGKLLEARFNATLTNNEKVKFNFVEGDASTFTNALGDDADVVIGGNTPLKNYALYDATNYPLVNAGAKHFANASRKVIIRNTVATSHVALAQTLYNFVKADAAEFAVHAAFWPKSDKSWVSDEEITALTAGMEVNLKTLLGVTGEDTLTSKYNVTFTTESVNVSGNKVADLSAATQALREGKGADLIVGCGGNIDSQTGYENVPKKNVSLDQIAGNRYVALINDNVLTRNIFDNYFIEKA